MIAVPCQRRIVEGSEASARIYLTSKQYAKVALLPLALGLSCDLLVSLTKLFGTSGVALACSVAGFALLVSFWYVVPLVIRRRKRGQEVRYALS
jgi:hypothetical protein